MYKRFSIIFGLILIVVLSSAQNKINTPAAKDDPKKTTAITIKHAASLSFDKAKSDAKILRGDVICEHDGAILYCDTAEVYDLTNTMKASGHILITKGDSVRVTGNKLFYDGKTKIATLEGNVKCIEKDMTLTTELLTFDVGNSVANYYNGGTIVNKENTLTSKNGHYYSSSKELAFHYDVELTNPDYKMKSDTLRYNTVSKTAYFLGPSIILSKDDYIYCENGWYDTDKERAQFSQNALLMTKQQKLKGDSLYYDRNLKVGRAFRNIQLIDTAQKSIIYGDYAEYHEKNSEATITKKPVYARVVENDTLYIAADTLYHRDIDSLNNFLSAYHRVRIYKKDLQAICDSTALNTKDSLLQLYRAPVLWSNASQATARFIKVNIGRKTVYGFRLEGNSFLIQQADTVNKFNQLVGKSIEGFIANDTIRKVIVQGNAEAFYYPKNKEKLMGLNKTSSQEIHLWFKGGDIDRVTIKPKTTGQIDPLKEVDAVNAKLKGFSWQYGKRPKSKNDLHTDIQVQKPEKTEKKDPVKSPEKKKEKKKGKQK